MKKNEVNKQVENVTVENNSVELTEKQKFIEENLNRVPKIMMNRFKKLSEDDQYEKIKHYIRMETMREEARERSRIVNRVRDIFDKRHATVNDAQEVLKYCEEYINQFKQQEIEKLDAEIQKLQALRQSLEK